MTAITLVVALVSTFTTGAVFGFALARVLRRNRRRTWRDSYRPPPPPPPGA